ncbi:MAG: hypothetical protein IKF38_03375 [Clostridia bacterium]|nr:hypothetical protein [Clostridia bacterium]
MFVFDISNPLTLVLMVAATILLIFLAQEVKRSAVAGITLIAYLAILIFHVAQLTTLSEEFRFLSETLSRCVAIDFGFILVSFFAYLWVDDIEAKANNKKSLDNSLDWFWKKI